MKTPRPEPKLLLAALLALAGAVPGCSSTGVGNPPVAEPGTLSLAIVSDDDVAANAVDASAPAPSLPASALERAVIVLGSVTWLPCNDAEPSVEQQGPFVVDLLSGETEPALEPFEAPAGGMCGFDAVLAPARASASLGARSLYFSGVRADGVEFVLFADVRATLRVRAISAQAWGTNQNLRLLWAMRPRRWAAQMELDMGEPREWNGGQRRSIVIDANRHPLLFALIRSRLASESSVFNDEDHDGALDEADRAIGPIGTGITETD